MQPLPRRARRAATRATAATLEWTTPSPPPHYNFAVIPRCRAPYPNWDAADRAEDARAARRAASCVLDDGHETPATTRASTASSTRCSRCRRESPWPIVLALCARARRSSMLLVEHYVDRRRVRRRSRCSRSPRWHWHEPEPEPRDATPSSAHAARRAPERLVGDGRSSSRPRRRSSARCSAPTSTCASSACTGRRAGSPEPKVVLPLVLAGLLVATSIPMQPRARAPRRAGRRGAARRLLVVALVVQARLPRPAQVHDFVDDLRPLRAAARAPTARSTSRCSARDHAHVARRVLLERWLLVAARARADALPARRPCRRSPSTGTPSTCSRSSSSPTQLSAAL